MSSNSIEIYTYEYLLNSALARVPAAVDKRQGSIIYDALAPACYQLAQAYMDMKVMLDMSFIGTSADDYLDSKVNEYGLTRIAETYAIVRGVFDVAVPINSTFTVDSLVYIVTELISPLNYKLQCNTPGEVGNLFIGAILPIDYIAGLTSSEITEILTPGRDAETDAELVVRFFDYINERPLEGNSAQYLAWANVSGLIGRAKVIPLWNGVNTVKVLILNAAMGIASASLIADFQEYLDPGVHGLGEGVAPIGAAVTVATATAKTINISLNVVLASGYTVVTGLQTQIEEWLNDISFVRTTVNYYELASVILANDSVSQIQNLTINTGTVDISLTVAQIPVLGTLVATVV